MVAFDVYDKEKNVKEKIELEDSVFSAPVCEQFLHQVLVGYQANQRQGTVGTKNRNMVHGTNRKPFRQKGTGRARQGTMHAAHHRHGARQFGPQPRSYRQAITKTMKRRAFCQTLSLKVERENFFILSELEFTDIKTKNAALLLKAFDVKGKTLLVDVNPASPAYLSIRNIQKTDLKPANECSPLDIFECDNLFLTKAAAKYFQQQYT